MRPDDYCNESNILRRVRYLLQTKHTSSDQLHTEVFGSGFAETSSSPVHENIDNGARSSGRDPSEILQGYNSVMRQFEDSDDEDDDEDEDEDEDHSMADTDKDEPQEHAPTTETTKESLETGGISSETYDMDFSGDMDEYRYPNQGPDVEDEAPRNVRMKLSHPSSPRSVPPSVEQERRGSAPSLPVPGPAKAQVIVRDAAYATYRAVLYYVSFPSRHGITQTEALLMNALPQIYTDTITFAPLSSTFLASAATTPNTAASAPATPSSESQAPAFTQRPNHQKAESTTTIGPAPSRSRREWIAQWERNNASGKPRPCSAKAVYRLADSTYHYHY